MVFACIFRRYDVRDGSTDKKSLALELFQTSRDDIDIVREIVTENTRPGSRELWVLVRGPWLIEFVV
jgi:hypothetical protein